MYIFKSYYNYAILYIALAIYSRCPSAFKAVKSLNILQLPSERTMKTHMNRFKKSAGINEDDMRQSAALYKEHKTRLSAQGKNLPLGEGVLIWDETKVWIYS